VFVKGAGNIMNSGHVAIAGGGLAGLACAKMLVDAGIRVTIVESEPFLGGRASTYRDEDGQWVEQGLHLYLGFYSEFNRLLEGIGCPPDDVLFWMDQIHFQAPDGPQATFGINPIHAPLKTIFSAITQNDYLGPIDKASLAAMSLPGIASMETIRQKYDGLTVTQWWRQVGGKENLMERLLRPACRGTQFTDPDEFSAYDLLGWVHHSITDIPNLRLGGYRGARDEIIFAPLGKYLSDRGAEIRTNTAVRRIGYNPITRRVNGFELASGDAIHADCYVVAVPSWVFDPMIPAELREDPFFAAIADLPVAPAISVQLWFDRELTGTPDFYLVANSVGPVYQQQSPETYPVAEGSRISVIVSPADDLLDETDAAIVEMLLASLQRVGHDVTETNIKKKVVLRHPKHLIRPLPGAMSARPTQHTPVDNLFLAGDWTQQEFFGSQEGAVRGGNNAAKRVLEGLQISQV
jgi:15-cis-phytoene desaturase